MSQGNVSPARLHDARCFISRQFIKAPQWLPSKILLTQITLIAVLITQLLPSMALTQVHSHSTEILPQNPPKAGSSIVFDTHELGLEEIRSWQGVDLGNLPREGIFVGQETLIAMLEDSRFDFSYCPELSELRAKTATPARPQTDADYLVFCIQKGTWSSPWNLSDDQASMAEHQKLLPSGDLRNPKGTVHLRAGQTLRIINLDHIDERLIPSNQKNPAIHRLHTLNEPCYHQPRYMPPAFYDELGQVMAASYYDCPSEVGTSFDSKREDGTSRTYNHQTMAPFYIRVYGLQDSE